VKTHAALLFRLFSFLLLTVASLLAGEHSGIQGATIIESACFMGEPSGIYCLSEMPIATGVKVYSDKGKLVRDFASDLHGNFELRLNPGDYLLVPYLLSPRLVGVLIPVPSAITVDKKAVTAVQLSYVYAWAQ
jgi:hypothetical protein